MSKLSSVLAWTTLILLVLMLNVFGSDMVFAADRKTTIGSEGIEVAPLGVSFTLNGYRANGTGSPDVRWVTGNLGNTWGEGEWVPYMLEMTGIPPGLEGLDSIAVSYDFMYPHGGDMYRFVDLIRGIQVGTTVLTDSEGWPAADGSAMPTTTDQELETAQNTPNEYFWTGFTPLNLPNEQINRTLTGGLDVPPGTQRHILRVNKSDLIAAGVPTNSSTVVIYFQIHLARTVVWNNQQQAAYDVAPTDAWGGYLYGTDGWPTAGPMVGSGYVPGASGHVGMEYPVTGRTVGLPIPEPSAGEAGGIKWHDLNGDGVMDGGEPPIPGWEIHVFGTVEGVNFATSILTDAGGSYTFEHLSPGTIWTIKEDAQRDVPPEVGYYQTYPSLGTSVGVGTGVAVGPPPTDVAGVGWSVALTSSDEVQPNMNFGNGRYEIGIICPDEIIISCDESIDPSNTGEPTVEGECPCAPGAVCDPVVTYDDVIIPGACPQEYTIQRTWTAECSGEGISVTCIQTIIVEDNTPPYWVTACPADVTVECDDVPEPATMQALDTCDEDVSVSLDEQRTDGSCPDGYTLTRTWTAEDDCANQLQCVQVLTVLDRTDPVITCPPDDTFECDETIVFGTATATDNCDPDPGITYDDETIPGSCPDSYTIERTWIATDRCGNTDECVQTITVEDTTDPYWTTECPSNSTVECDQVPDPPAMTADDNCDASVSVTFDEQRTDGSCRDGYTLTRTWTATDDCGNDIDCVQVLTVLDRTDPVITCPPDDTFECDETVVFGQATATDNCDPDPEITFDDETIPGSCPDSYTIERTWTATDRCGNTDECVQVLTVLDRTDPVITCPPDDTFECDETIVFGQATATDNCDPDPEITYDDETIPGSCPDSYTVERTWTATDRCGNSDECVQVLTVLDRTDPVITCPPDDTFECDETVVFGTATATDNCDPDPDITFDDQAIPGSCPDSYTIERTWTATDRCGNTDECVQVLTVLDRTDPVITCPPDDTFECDETVVFGTATATDNCDPDPEITYDDETIPGSCPDSYTIERTWTATDRCGNTDECVQVVTVLDRTDPVITCPPDDTFECDETIVFGQATATDNCDPDPGITFDDETIPGSCPDSYTIERTWTATDRCGNTDECVQVVTVLDRTDPVITCPPDDTFECDETIVFGQATATDNCDPDPGITFDDEMIPGSCPDSYTIERTWTATDRCGNTDECVQVVTVLDRTDPVITCPSDRRFECDETVDFGQATATDNCDPDPGITFDDNVMPGGNPHERVIERTWTATDRCGNTDQCVQTVTIVDDTDPVITCPPDDTFECDETIVFGMATATDNCDPDPEITYDDETIPGWCPGNYTIERTWTATDAAGNTDECVQMITVQDNTDPVITCPPDDTFECDETIVFGQATATDNCDPDPDITFDDETIPGSCPDSYTVERTWTATDFCGNIDQCVQTITVQDNTDPVITCPLDDTFECHETVVFGQATATDNCDPDPDITFDDETIPGSCPDSYTIERTWTATDRCGNIDQCVQTITVQDSTDPVITCPSDRRFECDETVDFGQATATDNCDPDPDITFDDDVIPGGNPHERVIERTWTATDRCGNTDQCVQTVTIVDDTDPVITCPPDDTFECDETIVFGTATATDNCDPDPGIMFDDLVIQGDCPNEYTIERTWTATDAAGNSASCLQVIDVVDTTPPVIICAPDKVAGCLDDVVFDEPSATDNCDEAPIVRDISTATQPGPGPCHETHTRTWEAEDACGNTSRCSQSIVQVFDETPPTLVCVKDKRIGCNAEVIFDAPTAFDNCDPSPVISIVSTDSVAGPGQCEETHTRTWEAEDDCRNISAQCSQVITRVVDTEPPVLTAAADKMLQCNDPVIFDPPEIMDNCDPEPALEMVSTVITDGPEICFEIHTRCWIGTDACGNVSDQVCQSVTVKVDVEAPVLTCAPDKTIPHGEEPIFDEPTVTDNCLVSTDIVEISNTFTSDPETQQEIYEKCWVISDDCGNLSNECCQTITVEGPPEPYCTFRCWDWGADCLEDPNEPVSTTPACIRDRYFDDLYPDGVMVGVEGVRTAVWTTPRALEEFLCSYGIPKVLRRDYVNPKRYELLGVLVGEVLCLRLNRDFSCAGYMSSLGYPAPDACFGNYVLPDEIPRFAGLTVDDLLEVCDQAVSGNTAVLRDYGANIDHLYTATVYVNWLFSGCNGAPTEPPLLVSGRDEGVIPDPTGEPLPVKLSLVVQPNPLYGSTTMRLALPTDAEVSIAVYDIQGRKVAGLVSEFKTAGFHDVAWNGTDDRGASLASGVYFCRVQVNKRIALMEKLVKL